ncbi:MAG: UDP-3-O-(3-hydroxymyristoyl)glucosamine N-acyltransferase [Victivallales bacterium]|nr:UDP-3-O-(3-hydroxymyristoyl)glucosamine N-acyltransferase [Victivallales bacterium]
MLITRTAQEIAALVGGTLKGDCRQALTGVSSLKEAMTTDVAFLGNEKYEPQVLPSRAGVVLVPSLFKVEPPAGRAWVVCENPSQAFTKVVQVFTPPPVQYAPGVDARAAVDPTAEIDPTASIGACAVIGKGAKVGARSVVGPGCFIGESTTLGEDCLLYANVTVRERCILGNRVILHPGVVIGADGFGYDSGPQGHTKVPQVGIVQLDDDVEIGANSCVDRARFGRTWIQQGTKIDNLVQVGHNCQIGPGCLLVGQCGISGSCVLGKGVIFAGQAGSVGHLQIADGTILMAQSGLTKDTKPGAVMMGMPAQDRREWAREQMYLNRVGDLIKEVKSLTAKVAALEATREHYLE